MLNRIILQLYQTIKWEKLVENHTVVSVIIIYILAYILAYFLPYINGKQAINVNYAGYYINI